MLRYSDILSRVTSGSLTVFVSILTHFKYITYGLRQNRITSGFLGPIDEIGKSMTTFVGSSKTLTDITRNRRIKLDAHICCDTRNSVSFISRSS